MFHSQTVTWFEVGATDFNIVSSVESLAAYSFFLSSSIALNYFVDFYLISVISR